MAPFYGPIDLSGQTFQQGVDRLRQLYPGLQSLTSYAGPGGTTQALGFEHGQANLFQGQPASSLDALTASQPNLFEGINVQPESITAAISGATTPLLGISAGNISSGSAGNGSATSAPGVSAAGSNEGLGIGATNNSMGAIASGPPGGNPGYSGGLNVGSLNIGSNMGSAVTSQGVVGDLATQGLNAIGITNPTLGTAIQGVAQGMLGNVGSLALGAVNSITGTLNNAEMANQMNQNAMRNNAVPIALDVNPTITAPNSSSSFNPEIAALTQTGPGTGMAAPGVGPGNGLSLSPVSAVTGLPGQPGLFSNNTRGGGDDPTTNDTSAAPNSPGDTGGNPGGGTGAPGAPGPGESAPNASDSAGQSASPGVGGGGGDGGK